MSDVVDGELGGEAMSLVVILAANGTIGLNVGDTAFSRDAVYELTSHSPAFAVERDGRAYVTLEGARYALGLDV